MNDTSADRSAENRAGRTASDHESPARPGPGPDRAERTLTEDQPAEHGPSVQDVPSPTRTELELASALEALAGGVQAAPDAYRTARGDWLRRERRRRLVLAVLITVVFALATLIGLWVLNQTPSNPGVIFSGSGDTVAAGAVPG